MTGLGKSPTCAVVWRHVEIVDDPKEHLRMTLPRHFVPTTFESVPNIPRNASGKIERK